MRKLENYKEYIITQYRSGVSSIDIAREFAVDKSSVLGLLRDNNIEIRKGGVKHKLLCHLNDVIKKYNSGHSLSEIAECYNCSIMAVRNLLHSKDVNMRPAHAYYIYSPEEKLLLLRLKMLFKRVNVPWNIAIIGCDIHEFKTHIESKFIDNMAWSNSNYWRLNFIQKRANFDLQDEKCQLEYFNFKNMYPYWTDVYLCRQSTKPKNRIFNPIEIYNICALYTIGKPMTWISQVFRTDSSNILYILRKNKIETRKNGWKRKRLLMGVESQVISDYLTNISSAKLAIKYNVSFTTIVKLLKRNNIPIKPAHKYPSDTCKLNNRIADNMRSRIKDALKRKSNKKVAGLYDLLGCSMEEFKIYLESQFMDGMNWSNYGYGNEKWNIDHKIPCKAFDLSNLEQQRKCFHYTNLRPLWQPDNFSKRDKILPEFLPSNELL